LTSTVIARRYAKALFLVAKDEGKLEEFGKTLQAIKEFMDRSPDVEAALISPVFPPDLKQKVVDEIVKAYSVDPTLAKFLTLLVEQHRIQHLRQIGQCYQELLDEEMGVVRAVVTTAVPIPDDLKDEVAKALAKAAGSEVVLQLNEDPSIIGGVVARIGDKVWDGSIRSQLNGFKDSIGRGELE